MAIQFFPVTIGRYDHWPALDVEHECQNMEELLADFSGQSVKWNAPDARDADLVEGRLREWAEEPNPENSVFYWLGHGWSDGRNAILAHSKSPKELDTGGIQPEIFYGYLRRRAAGARETWAIVIFDACGSKRFVERLSSRIYEDEHGPRKFLLIGSADGGAANLGRFGRVLRFVLTKTFGGVQTIELGLLGHELRRVLGDDSTVVSEVPAHAALRRSIPPVAGTQVDSAQELRAILATLTEDEQRHFIPKAQGAELGEFSWFFEGREAERAHVAQWLRHSNNGMLVITGVPGSGKSAFLGDLVVQSHPELRRALLRRDLITMVQAENRPLDRVFDAVIHLTGSTPTQLLRQIAQATSLGYPPLDRDVRAQTEWLISELRTRSLTLMVDALDEAQQCLTIAENVLRPLSDASNIRVIVGTRVSTSEGPDKPTLDQDILDALKVPTNSLIRLMREPAAISRYVFRRLVKALGHDEGLESFSTELSHRDREFLFARLAVRELIEEPRLLADQTAIDELLSCSHGELFTRAVDRFTATDPAFGVLLSALALAEGRGLPIVRGVWTTLAQSLTSDLEITDDHIDRLIELAAPYLILDVDNDETVYRLAHRTFVESILGKLDYRNSNLSFTHALVEITLPCRSADEWLPYVSAHLYSHAAAGGPRAWVEVDRLNPRHVALSALRHQFGQLLPEVAGIVGAQHLLLEVPADRRVGTRQLAMTRYGRVMKPVEPGNQEGESWGIRWARMRQHPIHLVLDGHSRAVNDIATFPDSDGGTLLASGSHDGTIRIWDPTLGDERERLTAGHQVNSLAWFDDGDAGPFLASAGQDGSIGIWDLVARVRIGMTSRAHAGPINSIISISGVDRRPLLVSGGSDRTIRVWDASSHGSIAQVGRPLAGHTDSVNCLTGFVGPHGRIRLASGSDDGSVVIWDLATGAVLDRLTGHSARVTAISMFRNSEGHPILCTSSEEATIMWDAANGSTAGCVTRGHSCGTLGSVAFSDGEGTPLLATSFADGTIRTWNPLTSRSVGQVLSGHTGEVRSIAEFEHEDGQHTLVSGGEDRTIRVWESSAIYTSEFEPDISGPVTSVRQMAEGPYVCVVDGGKREIAFLDRFTGEPLCSAGQKVRVPVGWRDTFPTQDGKVLEVGVRKWQTQIKVSQIVGHAKRKIESSTVSLQWDVAVPVITPRGKMLLAVSSRLGLEVQLFDPEIGKYLKFALPFSGSFWTGAAASFAAPDGSTMLAIGIRNGDLYEIGFLGLKERNPARFRTNHTQAIAALTGMGSMLIGGGRDGALRAWDPFAEREIWAVQLGVGICALDSSEQDIYVGTDEGIAVVELGDRLAVRR